MLFEVGILAANTYLGLFTFPVNTTHLYNIYTMLDQRRKRWADAVQMLYKCVFLFAGLVLYISNVQNWQDCHIYSHYVVTRLNHEPQKEGHRYHKKIQIIIVIFDKKYICNMLLCIAYSFTRLLLSHSTWCKQ